MRMWWLVALLACDEARDIDYRGELELAFDCDILFVPEEMAREDAVSGRMHAALAWSRPDGGLARVDPVYADCGDRQLCRVEVYARAPASAMRHSMSGDYALGQLVFFSDTDGDRRWRPPPDGASSSTGEAILGPISMVVDAPVGSHDPRFASPLQAGLTLVDEMWSCEDERVRFVVAPAGEARIARPRRRFLTRYADGVPHFFDPDCKARTADFTLECPDMGTIRYQCRHGDPASELCARCEFAVFPVAATNADCGTWRSRWDTRVGGFRHNRRIQEILVEERLCGIGEPPPSVPECDLSCACDKRHSFCLDAHEMPPESCDLERDVCLLY